MRFKTGLTVAALVAWISAACSGGAFKDEKASDGSGDGGGKADSADDGADDGGTTDGADTLGGDDGGGDDSTNPGGCDDIVTPVNKTAIHCIEAKDLGTLAELLGEDWKDGKLETPATAGCPQGWIFVKAVTPVSTDDGGDDGGGDGPEIPEVVEL